MSDSSIARVSGHRTYIVGLVLALILTAVPFGAIYYRAFSNPALLWVIAAAAILQILVHFRYFLRLDASRTPGDVLLVLVYACILIFVMVGGSLWIMFDLHHRMALPS